VVGDRVERLDAAERRLTLKSGRTLNYGALLLATGARPRRLDIPGANLGHVHVLRTLADSRAIIAALVGKKRAVVIGASFIGLEVAASLRHRGLEVDVVAPDAVPLACILGEEVGRFVKALHEEHGVHFHLDRKPTQITTEKLLLDDGSELSAPLVVVGVGVTPNTELADGAGLEVSDGIVVDAELRTNVEGIHAAGDVARYPDPISGQPARVEHWVHAERQGQAAARGMLGRGRPFTDAPFFWSQHYDVTLAYVGHAPAWDRIETRGDLAKRDYAAAYVKGDRIVAVLSVGRDHDSLRAEAAYERGSSADLRKLFEG
jgi:3-phenylpropionate/trans-cinnamate dioxygenase ferredoxin reductase subunit